MILTGKALEDFYIWYNCREGNTLTNNDLFYYSEELIQNALIIEWFDSECIHIDTYMCTDWTYDFKVNFRGYNVFCNSRQEATKRAIIKANEIYNERFEK